MFSQLIDQIDPPPGTVATADALHAQRGHADYLATRSAHYVLTVKGNQPSLHAQLKTLPWKGVPVAHKTTGREHGRVEKRILKVVTVATGIVFPHARQAIQLTRKTRPLNGTKWATEVAYAVTSLAAEQVTAADIARCIRGHWSIENSLHWVRDVSYDEDRSQAHTGNGPRVMASLRNLAVSALRIAGTTNIAQAIRHHSWDPARPVKLLLTS